jgi:hypothetical protein
MYEYYRAGHSLQETGNKYGKSKTCVCRCFKRHGLSVRTRSHALIMHNSIGDETRAMYADYQAGMTLRQIADKWHYSDSTIFARFKLRGFRLRSPFAWRQAA